MTLNPTLRDQVQAEAQNRPGIYQMHGPEGDVLYVGKSVRVRSRVLSYFRSSPGEKAAELIQAAARVTWEYVPNEFYALVREMKLIQTLRPRFNVQHKRKKRYAFIKVTREPAPRIVPTRGVVQDGATYYGPFPALGRTAETIRDLNHVLGLRDCPGPTGIFFDDQYELLEGSRLPLCLRADLQNCLAPCCGRCTSKAYLKQVDQAHRFLEGRGRAPLARLEREMQGAAARLDFEYAGTLKDRLDRLCAFQENLVAFRGRVESLSFVYSVPGYDKDDRLYLIRQGRIRAQISRPKTRRQKNAAIEQIHGIFHAPNADPFDAHPYGLRPEEAAEILLVARWFRLRSEELTRTTPPEKWIAKA